jgi:hypothetical protein
MPSWQSAPRRDHDPQVGRCVAQQVGQRVDGVARKALGFVDDQHDVQRRLGHLGEPGGDALDGRGRRPGEQRVAEGRAPGARAHRQGERLHEAGRIVLRLRRQPGHDGAARQVFAPPLGQQRCLAEPGRSLHQDHRLRTHTFVGGQQALARDEVARHTRRRDLEQQVTDAARGCCGRHEVIQRIGVGSRRGVGPGWLHPS